MSPLDPAEDVFTENCGAKEESVAGSSQVVLRESAEKSNQPLSTRPRSNSGRPLTDQVKTWNLFA